MSTPSEGAPFAGTLSSGTAPVTDAVEVELGADALRLRRPGEMTPIRWPYAELRASVPLRTDAADVLLGLKPDGAETLFVAEPDFARRLLEKAPGLSIARQRWSALKPGLTIVATVAAIGIGMWAANIRPLQAVARLMPQPAREAMGRSVIASLAQEHKPCETPAARAALDRLTGRLTAAASPGGMSVRVQLFDWELINAFAAPGGQIILTKGLVRAAGSPDEVAGVLAHEIGHSLELHPETAIVRAIGLSAAAQLIFAGSSGTLSNIGLLLTQLRYTRVAEREADGHAVRILKGAGISAKGFGDFFERIDKKQPMPASMKRITEFELIRTHPLTAERIAMVRAQTAYPATPALSDEDWTALRTACPQQLPVPAPTRPRPTSGDTARPSPTTADTQTKSAGAARDIAEASKALEQNPGDVAALQRRARAYARNRQHALALADYSKAVQGKPDDASLHYGRGVALQSLTRYDEALGAYDETLRLAPRHGNARNNRGNVYRALKRYDEALADFDELIRQQPEFIHAYYNRGLLHREAGRQEEALKDFGTTIARDKDYAAAYTSRGLLREAAGVRDEAITDFRAALTAPSKYNNTAWARRVAREHLKAMGIDTP